MIKDKLKRSKLQPFEVCEYTKRCDQDNCLGKDENRNKALRCGLRRWFLNKDGYKVDYS